MSAQRTVAFEKACVLFNLGALHTQIGARQERCTGDGLDASVDNFLRAASIFRFIVDNFTNAPSMDLAPQVLEALILLMISQARECLYEKLLLTSSGGDRTPESDVKQCYFDIDQDINAFLEQAQEAAEVCTSSPSIFSCSLAAARRSRRSLGFFETRFSFLLLCFVFLFCFVIIIIFLSC